MAGYLNYDALTTLLHFDSDYTDTSGTPKTWTNTGSTISSGVTPKFGPKCMYQNYAKIVCGSILLPASADWTIEAWVYRVGAGSWVNFVTQYASGTGFSIQIANNTQGSNSHKVRITNGVTTILFSDNTVLVPYSQWAHVAVSRASNTYRVFVNGVLSASASDGTAIPAIVTAIGGYSDTGGSTIDTYIDEFAIHNYAEYTSSFTPLDIPYADYPLNDKLIPRKNLSVTRPIKPNQNILLKSKGI